MSLVQVREKLKAVDKALGELNRALMTAGNELTKADLMIGSVMGEGVVNGRAKRRVRKSMVTDGGGGAELAAEAGSVTKVDSRKPMRRGRPRKEVEETGNSGTEAEA